MNTLSNDGFFDAHIMCVAHRGAPLNRAVLFYDQKAGLALLHACAKWHEAERRYWAALAEISDDSENEELRDLIFTPLKPTLRNVADRAWAILLPSLLNGTLVGSALHDGAVRLIHADEWRHCETDYGNLFLQNAGVFTFGKAIDIHTRPLNPVFRRSVQMALFPPQVFHRLFDPNPDKRVGAEGLAAEITGRLIDDGALLSAGSGDDGNAEKVFFNPEVKIIIPAVVAVVNTVRTISVEREDSKSTAAIVPSRPENKGETAERKCREYLNQVVPEADQAKKGETTKESVFKAAKKYCGGYLPRTVFDRVWVDLLPKGHLWRTSGRPRGNSTNKTPR